MKYLMMCLTMLMAFALFACATQPVGVVRTYDCCDVIVCSGTDEPIIFEDIMFDWDKDVIRVDQQDKIDRIVGSMNDHPDIKVSLKGRASVEGTDEYNLDLSTRRVNAVRSVLISKGVSESRIVNAQGMGETDMFGIELSPNRRVEVSSDE